MTQPLRVLLIDDNKSDRALILRELRREFEQLQVQEIIDAQDFSQAIANYAFDAVVTDYQLLWSNGLEILRTVKAHYPRCPVIMFTNTGTEEVAVEALKSGLDDYILKQPNRYIRVPAAVRLALERIETQQRAAMLEIRLQRLLNQVKIGIFRSQPDGLIIETNRAFLELFGVDSLTQINEDNLLDICNYYTQLADSVSPQQQEREIQLQRKDGTQFWVMLTVTLNQIEGAEVVDGLLEDITERKQTQIMLEELNATLEERVRERTAQLEAANQDLEEFAYSVSHDLRSPLRIIQGFAEILLEESESLDSTRLEYIQTIAACASKLDNLITDLLTYSRLRQDEITLQGVNLSLVLLDVSNQLQLEIQQRQSQVEIAEPLPIVQGNRLILIQVLINLLSNAIKFVAPNVQPQVRIWTQQRGSKTRLWIEDNGIGIAEDKQQEIFSPFIRLHGEEEYPGTGIGLAIVRKGVERMSGQVGVESQRGQGSRFWIELPTVMQ